MKIRKARISDSEEILSILNSTPELLGVAGHSYTKELVDATIKNSERNIFLIAEEKNGMIGLLMAELWKEKKYSFFMDLFVKKEFREKGVASKLEEEYEKTCKRLELRSIIGLVLVDNKKMQKWVEKRGYMRGNKMYYYEKRV